MLFLVASLLILQSEQVPHLKDEMSIQRIKADPVKMADKEIVICGLAGISQVYSYGYTHFDLSHHAFVFRETGATIADISREEIYLYLERVRADDIIERFADELEAHPDAPFLLVRAKVKLHPVRYFHGKQWNMLELLDIQFHNNKEQTKWEPWVNETKDHEIARKKALADKDMADKDAAIEKAAKDDEAAKEAARWRLWTGSDGKDFKARYQGINSGFVKLQKEDKSSVKLKVSDLPKDQQDWLKERRWEKWTRSAVNSKNESRLKPPSPK